MVYDFHGAITERMHPPNPAHLVVCFHPFGYTLPLCSFVHEPGDFEGLRRYAKWHYDRGVKRAGAGEIPAWWNGPFFCGWKEQTVTPGVENPKDAASQENYQRMSDTLDERLLRPSAVIIDDKWQKAYGTALPDPDKWPDMRAFVEGQNQKGRRVVLWFKSWDAEGLEDDKCILSETGERLAADPTSPAYRARVRRFMHTLLSADAGSCGSRRDFMHYARECVHIGVPEVVPIRINGVLTADLVSVDTPEVFITTDDNHNKKVYQLTFRPNGGQLVGDETTRPVSWNEPLPEAIRAVRPGYTFKGYMLTYYLAYDENYTPLINHPLMGGGGFAEAQWEPANYSITVDPNGGSLDGFEVQYAFDGSGAVYPDSVTTPVTASYTIESEKRIPYVMPPPRDTILRAGP